MTALTPTRVGLIAGLIAVVGLPLVGHWMRRQGAAGCALDGVSITPLYQVTIHDANNQAHSFCCVHCAQLWLRRQARQPKSITVTDEISGRDVDSAAAFFVRSIVVTNRASGNRVHLFQDRTEAEQHAQSFHGTLLTESERPFFESEAHR
jgi:hypothetical protein